MAVMKIHGCNVNLITVMKINRFDEDSLFDENSLFRGKLIILMKFVIVLKLPHFDVILNHDRNSFLQKKSQHCDDNSLILKNFINVMKINYFNGR